VRDNEARMDVRGAAKLTGLVGAHAGPAWVSEKTRGWIRDFTHEEIGKGVKLKCLKAAREVGGPRGGQR
jgi:hypothetical protein